MRGWILTCAVLLACGCESARKLRNYFHPEEAGRAALRVEVIPADGIAVLLDGETIATNSPYRSDTLLAGSHQLEVRADGYHPFTLQLDLAEGQELFVPVSLRKRLAPHQPKPPTLPPVSGPALQDDPPPPAPPPPLPPGVQPPRLQIATIPKAPLVLDGVPQQQRAITLLHGTGVIEIGTLSFPYAVRERGGVAITVPTSGSWSKDGEPLSTGATFVFYQGVARLETTDAGGSQAILFKRDR